jgi:uncharacterized delta-60 repeat protein
MRIWVNIYFSLAILGILFFAAGLLQAEIASEKWVARYNGPAASTDEARDIALDSWGNVYVTGYSYDSNTSYDYATIKYDPNGNQKWVDRYNGPGNGGDEARAIALDSEGNIYVTGGSYGSNGYSGYATVKYDPNGDEKWVARYNGLGDGYAVGIAVNGLGNVYVTGYSYDSNTSYDYATVKYDPNGNQKWVARYNGPGNGGAAEDIATGIAIDNWGNVYVTGYSYDSNTSYDYATIKYDPNGNQKWVNRYNGPGNSGEESRSIAIDNWGNVYITGVSYDSNGMGDYATIKYDPNGNEKWAALYNGPGNGRDEARAIALDSFGNVYVTGFIYDSNTGNDCATIKYDPNGNQKWVACYNMLGNSDDSGFALTLDSLGDVYVTGYSYDSNGYSGYTTIKYDSNGNEKWAARYNGPANIGDEARAIAIDGSGNVYVTGWSIGSGTDSDYATIKYAQAPCISKIESDLNNDCRVDFKDFTILASHWFECNLDPPSLCGEIDGDLNNDYRVNFEDFALFALHWLECNLDSPSACEE